MEERLDGYHAREWKARKGTIVGEDNNGGIIA